MIIKSAEFVKSAVTPVQYPPIAGPEVAFAGKSNVGKSSLINTLVNRKRLVKTSCTPGRTQLINFFLINESFLFVDLPGYGYAKVPNAVTKGWGPMIETYLQGRQSLRAVVLIMDLRRFPGEAEIDFIHWLEMQQISVIPVLTKSDKLSKSKQKVQRAAAADRLGLEPEQLILFSAKTRIGKEMIWRAIASSADIADTGDRNTDRDEEFFRNR